MQQKSTSILKVFVTIVSVLVLLLGGFYTLPASAQVPMNGVLKNHLVLATGTDYYNYSYSSSLDNQAVNILNVDLNNPYTSLEVGVPNPLSNWMPVSRRANLTNQIGHYVLGAVNASFFNPLSGDPLSLIAQNDQIINMGVVTGQSTSPLNKAVAFGLTNDGQPLIDYYHTNINFIHNGQSFAFDSVNGIRSADSAVLYTPSFDSNTTETNQWGTEIVVETQESQSDFKFGDTETGTVTKITKPNTGGNAVIPDNGFVISVVGDWNDKVTDFQVGDTIEINAQIDNEWKGAKFLLGEGPLLVKGGKVSISMSATSSFAKSLEPRTAVMIDKDKNQVKIVTVDGRQAGYSDGLSLVDFANYLISLGADEAINFDGGGSTTMSIRKPGDLLVTTANHPSAGYERYVSSILQVVNTAPSGIPTTFVMTTPVSNLGVNSSTTLTLKSILDQYGNPVSFDSNDITWGLEGDIGTLAGNKFTAGQTVGKGYITVTDQGVTQKFPVTISGKHFIDLTDKNYWAYNSIIELANMNVINGFLDGSFRPEQNITRLDAATMMVKQLDLVTKNVKDPGFKDVDSKDYGYEIIAAIASKGIVNGYKDGTFRPQSTLTRAEMAKIMAKAYNLESSNAISFKDLSSDFWAYKEIQSLVNSGISEGYPNNTYRANQPITRAEFATMIQRYIDR